MSRLFSSNGLGALFDSVRSIPFFSEIEIEVSGPSHTSHGYAGVHSDRAPHQIAKRRSTRSSSTSPLSMSPSNHISPKHRCSQSWPGFPHLSTGVTFPLHPLCLKLRDGNLNSDKPPSLVHWVSAPHVATGLPWSGCVTVELGIWEGSWLL